jgi:hypothetical protein
MNANNNNNNNNEIKTVFIPRNKLTLRKTKEIKKIERTKTTKVQSRGWNLSDEQKTPDYQRALLTNLLNESSDESTSYLTQEILKLLKIKQSSYKSQDVRKNKYCIESFVSVATIVSLLHESELNCLYCSDAVLVLYEYAYDPKQWTLDRVDNQLGHNTDNVVIACLECNLKRRITNKNKFQLGKKMVLTKLVKENA